MPGDSESSSFAAPQGSVVRREIRAFREMPRLAMRWEQLRTAPKGGGGVMVIPGYSTNDTAMTPLRSYLTSRGYRVWGWSLGTNQGQVQRDLPAVIDQVERRFVGNDKQPLALVGWSLGGVFAREIARDHPDLVSQIITMATPIYGGPRYTVSAEDYTEDELSNIESTIADRNPLLINRPITAFYTRHDGVVDWRTCIDDLNPDADNIEVESSHLGITFDPDVWLETAKRLSVRSESEPDS